MHSLRCGNHVYAPPLAVELDHARGQCEQRVIGAAADISAGKVTRATLPNNDAARLNLLPARHLDAQPLAMRLAAVAYRSLTLLMCHGCLAECVNNDRGRSAPMVCSCNYTILFIRRLFFVHWFLDLRQLDAFEVWLQGRGF